MVAVEASRFTTDNPSINLIEVWDIERTVLVETFVTRVASASSEAVQGPRELPAVEADTNPAAAIATLVRSRQATSEVRARSSSQSIFRNELLPGPAPDIRAMVVGLDFGGHLVVRSGTNDVTADLNASSRSRGFIVSGSEDGKIRLWDLGNLERTSVFGGLESEQERPSFRWVST
jgi:phosphoinositide-3-kinase regulatory subunit 4